MDSLTGSKQDNKISKEKLQMIESIEPILRFAGKAITGQDVKGRLNVVHCKVKNLCLISPIILNSF